MTLFLQFDAESEDWTIMIRSPGMSPMPAGPRIFRAPPHPCVAFSHATKQGAELDLQLIRSYFDNLDSKKPTKKQLREYIE